MKAALMRPLIAVLAVALFLASADAQSNCNVNQNYGSGYVCLGGYLCGSVSTCACPHLNDNGYDCYNPNVSPYYHCSASGFSSGGGDNSRGKCIGSSSGDPLVQGFDGCSWFMKGQAGQVFNLVSEAKHTVNTRLVEANLKDSDHEDGGTFHGAISVRYQDAIVVATVTPQGNLTVLLGDFLVPFETSQEKSGLTVKVSQYMPYYGQAVEISTPAFKFFLHAVQPYETPAGHSRGHLDITATIVASDLQLHGLLGQSYRSKGNVCPEGWEYHGEGTESDYLVSDLTSVDYSFSMYDVRKSTRRLHGLTVDYQSTSNTLVATSRGMN